MTEPVSITLQSAADYSEWRSAARRLIVANIAPDRVGFRLASATADLFGDLPLEQVLPDETVKNRLRVHKDFPPLARAVLCHTDAARFALLYRLLWRMQESPRLLDNQADPDVFSARRMAKSVRRDSHKMKAFVRFRRVERAVGEHFVAWFEPDFHIVERTAPFFTRRFTDMHWSIVTPERSAHWDGSTLTYSDGATRRDCPDGDALENHWRVYYASIFNPSRLKLNAMRSEMPVKYWRNLPESRLIPDLSRSAQRAQRAAPAGTPLNVATARRLVAEQPGMSVRSPAAALGSRRAYVSDGHEEHCDCDACAAQRDDAQ